MTKEAKTKPETLFVVNASESVITSYLRDAGSFSALMGTTWFCNTQLPPSGWINFTIAFCWIIWIFGRAAKHKIAMTPDKAREWLDEKYPLSTPERRS